MKIKLSKDEIRWILYDVGNSAFILLVATILPIYFNHLAESSGISSVNYLAYWGYTASVVTVIVALIGPIMGTISDTKDCKKPLFTASILIGCITCLLMGFVSHWMFFLIILIIAKIAFYLSLIFYDSMLSDITTEEKMDEVSAQGFAWGYIGSCIPFIICLIISLSYDRIGISFSLAMKLIFLIIALWWGCTSLPLLLHYKQKNYVEIAGNLMKESFGRIVETLKHVRKDRKVFLFLLAFFFYIDGVYTIIDMATAYGSALGLNNTTLLLALLLTQIVAFPFSILYGRLSRKYATGSLIRFCILAYFGITIFAVFLKYQWQFWALAVFVGMFQGGIQALSRSHYTKIIPKNQSGEYFALMDIFGKSASFLGTFLVGLIAQITGSSNLGVASLAVMFGLGLAFFIMSEKA